MMEKTKATCLYCGMIGEMEVKTRYVVDTEKTHLEEIECPRCRRLFCRRERKEEGEGMDDLIQKELRK